MARRATLTSETLAALGADKLAKLVLDEVGRNAPFKKIVTAALAGAKGPDAVAAIVDRRLAALERARGFIDWEKRKAFAADLRATLATITDELGSADPEAAVDRLVRFLACADGVFERVDDSSGQIQAIFHDAADALPALAAKMPDDDKARLVERLLPLLKSDDYGLIEKVVHDTVPLLQPVQLASIDAWLKATVHENGGSGGGTTRDWERLSRRDRLIRARQAIADREGDVDAFIALEQDRSGGRQDSMAVAERLLAAGRGEEALEWVRRPARRGLRAMDQEDIANATSGSDLLDRQRVRLEVRILMATGQRDAAQNLRWRTFEATLDDDMLREYVSHLPDFEDFDALERAFALAETHPHRYRSLGFFLAWPRIDLAAKLVLDHRGTWDGRHYGMLVPAAEALEHDHPAAATVLYRALIDDILARARSPAYGHAARYLAKLDAMSVGEVAAAGLSDHQAYRAELRRTHGRKSGFWNMVDERD
jgi:hypothetical protein